MPAASALIMAVPGFLRPLMALQSILQCMLPNLAGWAHHAERQATAPLTEISCLSR